MGDGGDQLKCSFCGKPQRSVPKLIAGPGVYICSVCVALCLEIIAEESDPSLVEAARAVGALPAPPEPPPPPRRSRSGRMRKRFARWLLRDVIDLPSDRP